MADKGLLKIVIPGLIGNVLEWYDFALYGYFAAILSPLFFPTGDKFLSLVTTFAVFAIGFIMRPLGAVLFGHFGDRVGRKTALSYAILLMALPTTGIGCLPTYEQIGISAPLLLIFFRLLQGLAVGGEFTGSIVYIIEHTPEHKRGFYGSLAMASAFTGLVLGSAVASMTGLLSEQQVFASWSWRIPFIISIALGGVGLYLRLGMPESPVFEDMKQQNTLIKQPMKTAFKHHGVMMLLATGIVLLPALAFYQSFVYLATYINQVLHVELSYALLLNTLSMMLIMCVIPFFGWLADRIGLFRLIKMASLFFIIFSYPLYIILQMATPTAIFCAQAGFALLVSASYAAIPAALIALFPPQVRYSAMSFSYNMANAIFGGTAPLMATLLIEFTASKLAPAGYLMIAACITLTAVLSIQKLLVEDKNKV